MSITQNLVGSQRVKDDSVPGQVIAIEEHARKRVTAIEYYSNGVIKRVEFAS